MTRDEAEAKVSEIMNLPSSFSSVSKVIKLTENSDVSISELAKIISQDSGLTTKILKLVNSGFYGFNKKITSINHAIALLGVNIIKGLALTTAVFNEEDEFGKSLVFHSLSTAKCSHIIADVLNLPNPEELAIIGLLHDIGKIIFKNHFEAQFGYIKKEVIDHNNTFYEAEKKHFDFDHSDLGGWILKHWNLPDFYTMPVKNHHSFQPTQLFARETAILQFANVFTKSNFMGSGWDKKASELDENVKDFLNLQQEDNEYIQKKLEMELKET